jgi:hypothetical protein
MVPLVKNDVSAVKNDVSAVKCQSMHAMPYYTGMIGVTDHVAEVSTSPRWQVFQTLSLCAGDAILLVLLGRVWLVRLVLW